jgi:acyl-CoA thioesterase
MAEIGSVKVSYFDDETAVEPVGDNVFSAHLSDRWNIGDNPNGGYLTSVALAALRTLGAHGDPLTVTTHYLRPGTPDAPAQIRTELIRSGRTLTTARATMIQEGKERIEVIAAFGSLSEQADGPELSTPPPDMPPADECPMRAGDEQGVELHLLDRLEIRIHPDHARAGHVGRAEVSGWIRFADGRPTDAMSLPLFADAYPPALFGLLGSTGWVPTVELTVHVRRRPAPGWLIGRFTTSDLSDGRMLEDGVLWDETGALVAQSRQLALLLT